MPAKTDVIKGALKINGLVDAACVESFADLVKYLAEHLSVEIPASITNVVIGPAQPGADERESLWVRLDNASNFIGLYVYAVGEWRQVTPVPNQLFWMYGDSRDVPKGFTLATESPRLSASQKAWIPQFWHWQNDTPNTWHDVFQVVYSGF